MYSLSNTFCWTPPEGFHSRRITLEISKTPSPPLLFPARNKHLPTSSSRFYLCRLTITTGDTHTADSSRHKIPHTPDSSSPDTRNKESSTRTDSPDTDTRPPLAVGRAFRISRPDNLPASPARTPAALAPSPPAPDPSAGSSVAFPAPKSWAVPASTAPPRSPLPRRRPLQSLRPGPSPPPLRSPRQVPSSSQSRRHPDRAKFRRNPSTTASKSAVAAHPPPSNPSAQLPTAKRP